MDALLGAVSDERFAQLVALGKLVTDWAPEAAVRRAGALACLLSLHCFLKGTVWSHSSLQ